MRLYLYVETRPISVIVDATPKTINVIDLVLFGFEVDGLSPEVVTANQRACEVRYEARVESQGTVITR